MERRTIIYGSVLTLLLVALVTVGVLILRKRSVSSMLPIVTTKPTTKKLPADTVPFDSLKKAVPWKPGDPIPPPSEFEPVFPEPTNTTY